MLCSIEVFLLKSKNLNFFALPIFQLSDHLDFPDPEGAEDGIVAIGGDLNPQRIISAYLSGIFPWYNSDDPIIWWSPDPRCVLIPSDIKVSNSMRQLFKKQLYRVTFDQNFQEIIQQCADVRYKDRYDTWLNADMIAAYTELHRMGIAHSVEVWNEAGEIVGGLYGLAMGKCFFGESMFHKASNASKYGFIALVQNLIQQNYELVDCQVHNPHLESLGATVIPRSIFLSLLDQNIGQEIQVGSWSHWTFESLEL